MCLYVLRASQTNMSYLPKCLLAFVLLILTYLPFLHALRAFIFLRGLRFFIFYVVYVSSFFKWFTFLYFLRGLRVFIFYVAYMSSFFFYFFTPCFHFFKSFLFLTCRKCLDLLFLNFGTTQNQPQQARISKSDYLVFSKS